MKKTVRLLAAALCIALIGGVTAGCGGSATADELNGAAKDFYKYVMSAEGQAVVRQGKAIDVTDSATKAYDTAKGSVSGSFEINGSTSVKKVVELLIAEYNKLQPDVKVTYQATGSGTGREEAAKKKADVIGVVSAELTDAQKEKLDQLTFAKDGVAVIVNADSEATDLTKAQIAEMFKKGTAAKWSEYGVGNTNAVKIYAREAGSGTRTAFEELLEIKDEVFAGASEYASTDALVAGVAGDPDGIGYASLAEMGSSVKAVTVEGVACTEENIKAGTYTIARPFAFVVAKGMRVA